MRVRDVLNSIVHVLHKFRVSLSGICLLCVVEIPRLVHCVSVLCECLSGLSFTAIRTEDTSHGWITCKLATLMRVFIRILLLTHHHHLTFALTLHHSRWSLASLSWLHQLLVVIILELSELICVLFLQSRSRSSWWWSRRCNLVLLFDSGETLFESFFLHKVVSLRRCWSSVLLSEV